tara:strand:- start:992 stop:1597 length:606 start_codon:yes stop_codon:yes gene_type:complete
MSTTSAPRGLKPISLLGGLPFAGSTMELPIVSNYGTAIFNGDVVGFNDVTNGTDATDGYIVRETAAGEVNPVGVFLGCSYTDPNTEQKTFNQYYPGSIVASDIKAVVTVNPTTLYEIQADGAVTQAKLGQTIDLVQTTASPSTAIKNSGLQADASTAAITGCCWRIVDFVNRPGSSVGDAYTDLIVMMNQQEHALVAAAIT